MYPGPYASEHPDRPAFVMASTGKEVSYRDYEARCNRLAHLLVDHGLEPLDHYSIFMENNEHYLEACGAGERAGLYFTCINSYLTAEEVAYVVGNSDSKVLITSGFHDEMTPTLIQPLIQGIRGAESVLFEGSAHLDMAEEPERYLAVVESFLGHLEAR